MQVASEEWAGSSWAEGDNLNTARHYLAACGTQTAALCIGGTPPDLAIVESYDGTSWTEGPDLNTGRYGLKAAGITTAALAFGGYAGTDYTGATE